MSKFITIEGELWYARTDTPETDPWNNTKWKVTVRPTKDKVPDLIDLIATYGLKNKLSKHPESGAYQITFSCPEKTKKGTAIPKPKVFAADGTTPLTDWIGNGSKGVVTLEMREFTTPSGSKGYSARLYAVTVKELIPYKPNGGHSTDSEDWSN